MGGLRDCWGGAGQVREKLGKLRWLGGGDWWPKTDSGEGGAEAGVARAKHGGVYLCA